MTAQLNEDEDPGLWANLDSYLLAGSTNVPAGAIDKARRVMAGRAKCAAELAEVLDILGIGAAPEIAEDTPEIARARAEA